MVHILTYLYPDGTFAGILGAYSTIEKAEAARAVQQIDYSDCTFFITTTEIE